MLDYRPKMFDEASKSHASKNIVIIILCFIAVFLVAMILEAVIPTIVSIKPLIDGIKDLQLDGSSGFPIEESMSLASEVSSLPQVMIPTLFSTVFGTITAIIYCRCIEMRPVRSMGARKKGFFFNYITGMVIGVAMMSLIAVGSVITKANSIAFCKKVNYGLIALYFLGFVVQGMSEEFIFRGYFMNTIGGSGKHTLIAVGVSSVGFALAHAGNPGFGFVPFINLTLFGVFAALYMVYTDNIWGVCAIHSVWNFFQGNIYGISVSGSADTESILRTTPITKSALLTGGKFGAEGSIYTFVVLAAGVAVLAVLINKKKNETPEPVEAKSE